MSKVQNVQRVLAVTVVALLILIGWHLHSSPLIRDRLYHATHNTEGITLEPLTDAEDKTPGDRIAEQLKEDQPIPRPTYLQLNGDNEPHMKEKLAYAIYYTSTGAEDDDLEEDNYFLAIRILVWQLLHVEGLKTKHDVVIMASASVSDSRIARLKKDGVMVRQVQDLPNAHASWIKPQFARWGEVMTKFRVFEMVEYDRVLLLDGDCMLRSNLDGIFDDPSAQLTRTKNVSEVQYNALRGLSPLPETYLLAGLSETWDSTHPFPPTDHEGLKKLGYFNAGFFMLAPSLSAFAYYTSLLSIENSFDPKYPEQNLLNAAHAWQGPMPWRELAYHWNIRNPNENDFDHGVVSVHEKWWMQPYTYGNEEVKRWLYSRRWEMKGWYDGIEGRGVL